MVIFMNKNQNGFTLIEVLVSIAIVGILSVSLVQLLQTAMRVWNYGSSKLEIYNNMSHSLENIILDIKSSVPAFSGDIPIPVYMFQSEQNACYKSGRVATPHADRLDFVSTSGRGDPLTDYYNILGWVYFLSDVTGISSLGGKSIEEEIGNHDKLFLIRKPIKNVNTIGFTSWTSSDLPSRVLGSNITSIKYSFCDENFEWIDEWESTNNYLPKALKITLFSTDDGGIYGNPEELGNGDSMSLVIRIFQENTPDNWW
jgi:prepilin-type N-terminal cleavage/methylation domain-containing protein